MSNYLVTGGAGFIGSNLVKTLLAQGHAVRVLDNFSTGKHSNLQDCLEQIELIEGDLTILEDVRLAVKDIEFVLHQGAVPSVAKSVENPLGSNEANINGTLHVLVAARDAGVSRVVFASSSSIYGDQDPNLSKVETMQSLPISPYGVAKLAAERYCQVFYQVYGLETVALRYFNVFGPHQDPQSMYAAVIPRFITAFLQGQAPIVYGDGEQTRDFTYVENVVNANILAATVPAKDVCGEFFNIAAGGQTSLNTLIEMLHEITGLDTPAVYQEVRPGDIKHSRADIAKATSSMGYHPQVSLQDGLRRTVEWYRQTNGN
ncbi:MAG: SDR family oxidoreductase [Anaerolineae bacterium]|nr:SDR family oxidoreductase [Anaerolineae bacterium]